MNKYCVLRNGGEFKILYMDREAASQWRENGWELRACETNAQAQQELERWKATAAPPLSKRAS